MFFGMTYFTGAVLNVSDELRKRLFIVWIALGLNGGLDILLLSKGYGILGVAWGSTISYVILAVGLLLSCNRMVYGEYRIAIIFLLRFLLASTILWLGLHILDGWQIGKFLKELPRILNVGREFAFAGLKFLIYASFALLLYGILFLPYKPVDELFHSAKYMVSLFKKRISQKSSLVVN
jgi:hypothetical protein